MSKNLYVLLGDHMNQKEGFDLNLNIFRLLRNEPFFAEISKCVTKISTESIPTIGVRTNPNTGYFEMFYNPHFLNSLGKTDENGNNILELSEQYKRKEIEILGCLKHEYYHLIFEHITGRSPVDPKNHRLFRMWNIACDLAINCHISKELPINACIPGKNLINIKTGEINEGFKNYPPWLTAEHYYKMLQEDERFQSENENFSIVDDHSLWNEETGQDSITNGIAKERLNKTLSDATSEIIKNNKGWGSISKDCQKQIIANLTSVLNWRKIFRYFIKTSQKSNKVTSIKIINKRYPYIHSGKRRTRTSNIAISIDQSGSVSDQMLSLFFSELNELSKIATFTVIPFDDKVFEDKIYIWEKGKKYCSQRVLSGGTNFDAPTDYVNNKNFDGHIILTDMHAEKPKKSKVIRIWITTESCSLNPVFQTQERIIVIPDKEYR